MIVPVYVNGCDDSDKILMTKKDFEDLMKSLNVEMDAAYERGYRDGRNSASTTPVTTPTIAPFEYGKWWENPLCKKNTITCDSPGLDMKLSNKG